MSCTNIITDTSTRPTNQSTRGTRSSKTSSVKTSWSTGSVTTTLSANLRMALTNWERMRIPTRSTRQNSVLLSFRMGLVCMGRGVISSMWRRRRRRGRFRWRWCWGSIRNWWRCPGGGWTFLPVWRQNIDILLYFGVVKCGGVGWREREWGLYYGQDYNTKYIHWRIILMGYLK